MAVQYSEIQELLRSRADLNARLSLMPYDGTPEIKERGDGKYLYVRKRAAGKLTSTYVGAYTEELYNLLCAMPEKPVKSESRFAALKSSLLQPVIPKMTFPPMLSTTLPLRAPI